MAAANPFEQQKPIPGVKKIIAVSSGKGGVGKSTVSSNLAVALAQAGQKVGLLDADIYGPSQPRMMGALHQKPEITANNLIKPVVRHGIKIMSMGFLVEEDMAVVWRGPMLFKAMNQLFYEVEWGDLDILLVDLPPGTGDVQLSMVQKVPVSGAITVCTPQNIALADVKKSIDMFQRVNVPILGVIENMAYYVESSSDIGSLKSSNLSDHDDSANVNSPDDLNESASINKRIRFFPPGDLHKFLQERDIPLLGEIPMMSEIAFASEMGIPYTAQKSADNVGQVYKAIAERII